jgi:hypothetical protein
MRLVEKMLGHSISDEQGVKKVPCSCSSFGRLLLLVLFYYYFAQVSPDIITLINTTLYLVFFIQLVYDIIYYIVSLLALHYII